MPIAYARWDFVKRSNAQNVVVKAAYNGRAKVAFHGNVLDGPKVYDYSYKKDLACHFILLPKGADEKFLDPETLWNEAESKEVKKNSQVAFEGVLALPDDEQLSVDDRAELARGFVNEQFVKRGLAAQVDIHQPDKVFKFTKDDSSLNIKAGEGGKLLREEGEEFVVGIQKGDRIERTIRFNPKKHQHFEYREHNWHAHVLVATRRFTIDGKSLGKKVRDITPQIRTVKGNRGRFFSTVIEKSDFGKKWEEHQNAFFLKKGLDLRVDPPGIVPQRHLGPIRMRARAFDLLEEYETRLSDNKLLCGNVEDVLEKLTEQRSIFDEKHVNDFIEKHVEFTEDQKDIKASFWKQEKIVPLLDPKTQKATGRFSTQALVDEERVLFRLAEKMHKEDGFKIVDKAVLAKATKSLNSEQKKAFKAIISGRKLSCLQGFAGTGKGRVLSSLRIAYTAMGYTVRGFGPDNSTANVLKEKGFWNAENTHKFMFCAHHGSRNIKKGKEVWICDEASKLGNVPFIEFLKLAAREKAQVVFSGDKEQISSIDRGGIFTYLQERYGAQSLKEIQRQKTDEQREISKKLATGNVGAAFNAIERMKGFKWSSTRNEAIQAMIEEWAKDRAAWPQANFLMIAHSNAVVNTLNELARIVRKERGELSKEEFCCEVKSGKIYVSPGDRIEFRKKDKDLGITNGLLGTLVKAEKNKFVVSVDQGGKFKRKIIFNPQKYNAFQLGYATTYFRSQGETVDRCYVLDSPHLNKENFYVALTRHISKVQYFVYKGRVKNLTDLKSKAMKDESKRCTLHYVTNRDLELKKHRDEKNQRIAELKEGNGLLSKARGHFLAIKGSLSAGVESKIKSRADVKPDRQFFNPSLEEDKKMKAEVSRVVMDWADQSKVVSEKGKNAPVLSDVDKFFSEMKVTKGSPLEKRKNQEILEFYKKGHLKGLNKQIKSANNYSEKEELIWGFKHRAMRFIESASKVKKSISLDPLVNAKGEVADRLTYQMMIFKAKEGRDPSLKEIIMMKEVISEIAKGFRFKMSDVANKECLEFAKDKVLSKHCEKALKGQKVVLNSTDSLKDQVQKTYQNLLVRESKSPSFTQSKQLQKGYGIDPGP